MSEKGYNIAQVYFSKKETGYDLFNIVFAVRMTLKSKEEPKLYLENKEPQQHTDDIIYRSVSNRAGYSDRPFEKWDGKIHPYNLNEGWNPTYHQPNSNKKLNYQIGTLLIRDNIDVIREKMEHRRSAEKHVLKFGKYRIVIIYYDLD